MKNRDVYYLISLDTLTGVFVQLLPAKTKFPKCNVMSFDEIAQNMSQVYMLKNINKRNYQFMYYGVENTSLTRKEFESLLLDRCEKAYEDNQ